MGLGPAGFLVTRGDDIQFIPARSSGGISSVFEKVPDLVEKIMNKTEKKKAEAV